MSNCLLDWQEIPLRRDPADFNNLLSVLQRQAPSRPTLFEFIIDGQLIDLLTPEHNPKDSLGYLRRYIAGFYRLGFDHATVQPPGFSFKDSIVRRSAKTISLNEGAVIHNRQDFDAFEWPQADSADFSIFDQISPEIPKGMKLIPFSPDGVLENVVNLVGYEALCFMLVDDPQLVEDIFFEVGSRLLRYYEKAVSYECVGACIVNDDWGFKTSTLLSVKSLRQLVFPWARRIVELCHSAGKPAILHSCGYFEKIIEDIIVEMKFDGRHSYEDAILPVEEAYERYHERIAILGGIDVDFICRSSPAQVYERSQSMLERTSQRGSYALGTGNSVPEYMPQANYLALLRAALDLRQ